MKRIINVYGCSWTQGIPVVNNCKSWPYYLSHLVPENYEIHNYALAGSSLDYSILQLQKYKDFADINIFQVTATNRITDFNEKFFTTENLIEFSKRYKYFDFKYGQKKSKRYTVANRKDLSLSDKQWYKNYLNIFYFKSKQNESIRHSQVYYAKKHSNFVFGHLNNGVLENLNVPINEKIFSSSFNSYVQDEGSHFGELGSKQVAKYVYDKIKKCFEKVDNVI